jgi:eukaryotic-like serine/threonine-protein kinase
MATGPARGVGLPARIGRHDVLGFIATGGMAELFLGRDPQTGRIVVIKRILPHLARQGSFVAMFIDEARIGSMIKHPNLVEIYELGQVGTDLFLVMEYLGGENLAGVIRRLVARNEQMQYALAAHVVAEACVGLHAAHTLCDDETGKPLEVVHRDVSPSNIFVTYNGIVKVLDFGIASAANRLTQTATGQLKGKVMYMSPEQCRGEQLDRRSDIFSLGVVLYELSMQRRLFKRSNELMVLKAVCDEPVPRPSRERRDYPPALEAICMRALSRHKEDRYESAWQMHDELRFVQAQLGGQRNWHAILEAEITRLFQERVVEKQQIMRHVRAGTDFGSLPAAEVDESIDVPQVSQLSASRPLSNEPTRSDVVARKSRWWIPVLLLLLLAGGGGAGWWWWQQLQEDEAAIAAIAPTPSPAPTQDRAPAPTPSPAPAPPPAVEIPSPPTDVVLAVETDPAGATVLLDGKVIGTSPLDLKLPRGTGKVHVEIRHANYETLVRDLVPDKDQRVVVALAKEVKKSAPVKKPKPKPEEFKKFD